MDTNQNNTAQNYQINAFTKGMNTDTSYDMLNNEQYVFGLNIRITNNTLLNKLTDANSLENIVAPIKVGDLILLNGISQGESVLAINTIGNVGAIVTKASLLKWVTTHSCVYDTENKTMDVVSYENTNERYALTLSIEKKDILPNTITLKNSGLCSIDYTEELDYENAFEYFYKLIVTDVPGFCSSARKPIRNQLGRIDTVLYGRNLDWFEPIDKQNPLLNIVLLTYGNENDLYNKYNVLGIASMSGLTQLTLDDEEKMKIMPFLLQDGINEKGVYCNINVVPRDKGNNTLTTPEIELRELICTRMLVRYILGKFDTAKNAVDYLKNYVGVYMPKNLVNMHYDSHFMIGDSSAVYILEFVDNTITVVGNKTNRNSIYDVMTNFHLTGTLKIHSNSEVFTPEDYTNNVNNDPVTKQKITPYGAGLERYNYLITRLHSNAEELDVISNVDDMRELMNGVLYSKAYDENTTPFWYSELVGPDYGITLNTKITDPKVIAAKYAILHPEEFIYWKVYRIELKDGLIETELKFTSTTPTTKDRFSTVINKEIEDHVKLYIADGEHEVMCLDLDGEILTSEDAFISNKVFPTNPVMIEDKISGLLKTQLVQYTYRFYKKFGITSRLAPLTNKIQVIDNNRNREIGNAEDTVTSIGFKLSIEYTEDIQKLFDHILIFRLSYIKPGQNAEVNLIYDAQIDTEDSTKIYLNDTGILSLAQYTIEEFAALYGTVIVPQVLELNQGYLFAGNIKDNSIIEFKNDEYDARAFRFKLQNGQYTTKIYKEDLTGKPITSLDNLSEEYTILKYADINNPEEPEYKSNKEGYLGGEGLNISWNFITKKILLDDNTNENTVNISSVPSDTMVIYDIKSDYSLELNTSTYEYLLTKGVSYQNYSHTYNDMFISSTFRSLARDEVYRYGIVFYNKYGVRSNTLWIADIRTPSEKEFPSYRIERESITQDEKLIAYPIGILFKVKKPTGHDIIGYQIVRCEKSNQYTKNLMQCALSRPLCLGKYNNDTYRTPYYPNMFLSTLFFYIRYGVNALDSKLEGSDKTVTYANPTELWSVKTDNEEYPYFDKGATNVENETIYLIFSPEILYYRQDKLTEVSLNNVNLLPLHFIKTSTTDTQLARKIGNNDNLHPEGYQTPTPFESDYLYNEDFCLQQTLGTLSVGGNNYLLKSSLEGNQDVHKIKQGLYLIPKYLQTFTQSDKNDISVTIKYYNTLDHTYYRNSTGMTISPVEFDSVNIKNIEDVQNPTWEQGFSNVQLSSDGKITTAIKEYKSFTTSVGTNTYLNWICNGMYNLAATKDETSTQPGNKLENRRVFTVASDSGVSDDSYRVRNRQAYGWIGPGPICFVAELEIPDENNVLYNHIISDNYMGTVTANILHTATQFAGLTNSEKQYDIYYGFGNYSWFGTENIATTLVFDGTKYITPVEFINMYKTYDFNDIESTIPSGLMVYYIPMESDVNTYFDYGMNYRNTSSANILVEPGTIDGVKTQDRAVHQYNRIYSDNHVSNDVFSSQSLETTEYVYPQRIYYSLFKTNGEYIDNWLIFKPADMIDADTRYGLITNLLSSRDILYFWQTNAFGKLSVNERSLVTDNNSNTVLLGQGGVLQRTDYISTHYGMREQDFSAITAEDGIFWVDILNNAIVAASLNLVINYGEALYVLNIVNHRLEKGTASVKRPTIDYDILNQELICNILQGDKLRNDQLVFSLKLKAATSVYTRDYDVIANFNNALYGVNMENVNATKYNYLDLNSEEVFLSPTILSFVVNSSPSLTKVFDNLKVVVLNKGNYNEQYGAEYFKDRQYDFLTEMNTKASINKDNWNKYKITDRENNICYTIPRFGNDLYGNRLRGKWMRETITDTDPKYNFAISHIITKFRQSYS